MATIISISSDEEPSDDCSKPPMKKRKLEQIICLDEDEEKPKVNGNNLIISQDQNICTIISVNSVCNQTQDKVSAKSEIKECDIILDSDDEQQETEPASGSKVMQDSNKTDKEHCDFVKMFESSEKMQTFIKLCLSKVDNTDIKSLFISKIPICKRVFDKVDLKYINSPEFHTFLDDKIVSGKVNALAAISSFNDVYQHLKTKYCDDKSSIEVSEKHRVVIKKLERALQKVQKIILKLEEAEVNFNDDENSNYIKMQRFRERAVKIYEQICKYKGQDPNSINFLYNRLDFSGSNYTEFNHAINKKFKNNSVFPTYYEVERCLKKIVTVKNMNISDSKFKAEARECFKHLGNLLQKRRKVDLLNVHSCYLINNDDPACGNEELEAKLGSHSKEAKSKIEEICEKYAKLQDSSVNLQISSDSDDSRRESSDEEDND